MSEARQAALDLLDELHRTIDYADYLTLHDGLNDIETIEERDRQLEELWAMFADIPMDPETELMEAPFLGFPAGTNREDIWHWFDERYSRGVAALLYGMVGKQQPKAVDSCHLNVKPCPICGNDVISVRGPEDWKPTFCDPDSGGEPYSFECSCGLCFSICSYDFNETVKAWNRRCEK